MTDLEEFTQYHPFNSTAHWIGDQFGIQVTTHECAQSDHGWVCTDDVVLGPGGVHGYTLNGVHVLMDYMHDVYEEVRTMSIDITSTLHALIRLLPPSVRSRTIHFMHGSCTLSSLVSPLTRPL